VSELILFRHAKSDWNVGGGDAERPLSLRGRQSARTMGRALATADRIPDLVLCSPARRARLTVDLAAEAGNWRAAIIVDERLCPGSPRQVIESAREHGGKAYRVAVVGHEPALSQTAALLLGGACVRMVTAAAACLEVDDWEALGPRAGSLLWMLTPRLFSEGWAPRP
jgi:phosphohistidine phosphatase